MTQHSADDPAPGVATDNLAAAEATTDAPTPRLHDTVDEARAARDGSDHPAEQLTDDQIKAGGFAFVRAAVRTTKSASALKSLRKRERKAAGGRKQLSLEAPMDEPSRLALKTLAKAMIARSVHASQVFDLAERNPAHLNEAQWRAATTAALVRGVLARLDADMNDLHAHAIMEAVARELTLIQEEEKAAEEREAQRRSARQREAAERKAERDRKAAERTRRDIAAALAEGSGERRAKRTRTKAAKRLADINVPANPETAAPSDTDTSHDL